MNIVLSSIDPPTVEVIVSPSPMVVDVIGLPGQAGPPGPPGPAGADGTIVHVGPTPPPSPSVNDLWVDTT